MATLLSADEKAAYNRDGYVVLRSVFTPEEVLSIAGWCDEVQQVRAHCRCLQSPHSARCPLTTTLCHSPCPYNSAASLLSIVLVR